MNQRKDGILLSYINVGINALIMLVYVPMLLHYVSKAQYGVYQMVGSFISVIAIFDFGLSTTVTRFLSREKALNQPEQQEHIIQVAATLYLAVTVLLLLVGVGAYFFIKPLYQGTLSAADILLAQHIYWVLLFNFAVCIPGNLFGAILQAHERFVFLQLVALVGNFLVPLLIWWILSWKATVMGVVWVQTGFNVCIVLLNFLYCKRNLGLRLGLYWKNRLLSKQLVQFSFFVFLGNVAWQLYNRLGPVVIGLLIGAVAVANYYIASQLLMAFLMIPALIGAVFLPKLTGDYALNVSLETHNDIFCKTGRLQLMVALLVLTGFILLGKSFLCLWIGPGNEVCYVLAVVLMTGSLVNIAQSVGSSILLALDKYRWCAWLSLAIAGLNVGLAFPLIKWYGIMGCAVAYVLSVCLINGILLNLYYRKIGLRIDTFFRQLLPIVFGSSVVGAILWVVWQFWPVRFTWGSFIAHACCVVAVFGIVMSGWVWNRFEWNIVREVWEKITLLFNWKKTFRVN